MKQNEYKELYLAMADLTEVKFATRYFGTYESWLKYVEKNLNTVSTWRKELELTLKQEAYETIFDTMRGEYKPETRLSAAKFLLQKGVLNRDGPETEMTSEDEVKERVKGESKQIDNDYLRLIVQNAR